MTSALSALERASSERSRAEAGCRGCVPCLFQDCGQQSGSCCKYNIFLAFFILLLEQPEPHLCSIASERFLSVSITPRSPLVAHQLLPVPYQSPAVMSSARPRSFKMKLSEVGL